MTWLALAAPALVLAFVLTAWPYAEWRRAGRLGRRPDGSTSRRRRATERSRRRQLLARAGVLPVAAAALVGGAFWALHTWTPWSAAAAVFGTAHPETDLLAWSLVERVEERARAAADETAVALPDRLRVPGKIGVRNWLFEHFPLHPLAVVFAAFAGWRLVRWSLAERRRYLDGLGRRMRAYQRHDLRTLRGLRGPSAPPARGSRRARRH